MSLVFQALAVTLGIVLTWGLFAPRSQWKILTSWSVTDARDAEPGPIAFGIRQGVFALGIVSMIVIGVGAGASVLASLPKPPRPVTAVELMWGAPDPTVIDRVVTAGGAVQPTLVDQRILGYQAWEENEAPAYLFELKPFTRVGVPRINGYIGSAPEPDLVGLDTADLVVQVRGDLLCVPRASVVVQTETAVQIAIYYGLPTPNDGSPVDSIAACSPEPAVSLSVLIPVNLAAPVGDREVQYLDGTPIPEVFDVS